MSKKTTRHRKRVQSSFSRQAETYRKNPPRGANPESVEPMINMSVPGPFDRVLDVGTGAGYVAFAYAPFVRSVVGVDLTPEMVKTARALAKERGIENVEFRLADAEALPFPDASFDVVVCRFTLHHFRTPEKVLREMHRVVNATGRVVIYDMITSQDRKKAKLHNEIELERDPSHVRMLPEWEWEALFRKARLAQKSKLRIDMKRDFDPWMKLAGADGERCAKVRGMLEKSIEGDAAGLHIRVQKGQMNFTHTCMVWMLVQEDES